MTDFTRVEEQQVWEKANTVKNVDKNIFRKDYAGAWIKRDQYGKQTEYGWEVDHVYPKAKGGSDDLRNLKPLHWQNNATKGCNYPKFTTSISSDGNKNIKERRDWKD